LRRNGIRLADVDADRHVRGVAGQPQRQLARAFVVESHPVEQCAVVGQPEHPRRRITGLRAGGHGAHLGKAEAQCAPRVQPGAVFVETGRQSEWTGEPDTEHRVGQHRVTRSEQPAQRATQRRGRGHGPQQGEHPSVDALGGDQEQHPPQRAVHPLLLVVRAAHRYSPG
jgi:hypothetical protein